MLFIFLQIIVAYDLSYLVLLLLLIVIFIILYFKKDNLFVIISVNYNLISFFL